MSHEKIDIKPRPEPAEELPYGRQPIGPSDFNVYELRSPSSVSRDDVYGRWIDDWMKRTAEEKAIDAADRFGQPCRVVCHEIITGPGGGIESYIVHVVTEEDIAERARLAEVGAQAERERRCTDSAGG